MAVIRCGGEAADADKLVAAFRGHAIDRVWRKGMPGRKGQALTTSGVTLPLWEGRPDDSWSELVSALKKLAPSLSAAKRLGANCELDLGIEHRVTSPTVGLRFPVAVVQVFGELELDLSISNYLTSSE
jgi:hypothetical protein